MKNLQYLLQTLSYQELANMLGYRSRSTIHHWLKNNVVPKKMESLLLELARRERKCRRGTKWLENT